VSALASLRGSDDLGCPAPASVELEPEAAAAPDDAPGNGMEPEASFFGSHLLAGPVRAISCIRAVRYPERAAISHQTWFWANVRPLAAQSQ
jgi:hypothetical protein